MRGLRGFDRTARALGVAVLLGLAFWIVDGVITYYYFGENLRFMMFEKPDNLLDAIVLNLSRHTLFVRISFLIACIIGGFITSAYVGKQQEMERRYRLLFDNAPVGIGIASLDGQILTANAAMLEITGYSERQIKQTNVKEMYLQPQERSTILKRLRRDGVVQDARLQFKRPGGTLYYANLTTASLTIAKQELMLTVIVDITKQVKAEQDRTKLLTQVREQAQQMQQIMNTVPEGVILLSADKQILLTNPLGSQHLDTLAAAHVQDTLTRLGDHPLEQLLTSPPQGLWHEVKLNDETFQVIARPIEEGPSIGGWVLVIRDVTRQRQAEQYTQQQERLATVGQLAAGVAHDFNNIMATIVLYSQMVARTADLSSRNQERLATVNQQAQHAVKLIQQILDFSRRAVFERQPLSLLPLLKEHVKLLQRTLPENIQIALTYDRSEPMINADPTRLQQVLTNLALNARDAMPDGGTLRIKLEQIQVQDAKLAPQPEMDDGEWIKLTVSDTGSGIPPEVLPHVFDPFFTTKAPGQGNGLGLAQVYGIVKQHQGHIDVQSQVGQGTTFTLYLPALPVYLPQTLAPATPDLEQGHGETILVVEDNAAARQALVDSLELLNYNTLTAQNGQEALTQLEKHKDEIALLLSDVVMPTMGGVALLRALQEKKLDVRVLLVTGHPLNSELDALKLAGLVGWLSKPLELAQLAQAVANALSKHKI